MPPISAVYLPSHPPLTDVSIGAYTIAVALLVLGALGLEEPAMAHGALLAISAALILALAGEALLFAVGYLGGALVYVHGHRVLSQHQAPVGDALLPGCLVIARGRKPSNRLRSCRGNPRRPGKDIEEATVEDITGRVLP